jgi:putative transposase
LAGRTDGTTRPGVAAAISRNGVGAKTVLTEMNSSFDPQIVKKRQRRTTGIDEIVCL